MTEFNRRRGAEGTRIPDTHAETKKRDRDIEKNVLREALGIAPRESREVPATGAIDNSDLLRRRRAELSREGIDEGDRNSEKFERSQFMSTIDSFLKKIESGDRKWIDFEVYLSSRAMFDAFVRDGGVVQNFTEWPKTVKVIISKIQAIVRKDGFANAKAAVRAMRTTSLLSS